MGNEKQYVLFSTLGNTDPVAKKGNEVTDGSMRYIVRHYKPVAIHLFYTAAIVRKSDEDKNNTTNNIKELEQFNGMDRYHKAIFSIQDECEVTETKCANMESPNRYDTIQHELPTSIREFRLKYPATEYTMIMNLTSGTPAMKAIMAAMTAELPNCIGVEVENPHYKDIDKPYDDSMLVESIDNKKPLNETRHQEESLAFLRNYAEKNKIVSLVDAYRYNVAYEIATTVGSTIPKATRKLLNHGQLRTKLLLDDAKKALNVKYKEKLYPIQGDAEKMFEYFLVMQALKRNDDLSELLTKITPYMFDLLLEHVKRNIPGLNFVSCCDEPKKYGEDGENVVYTMVKNKMDRVCPGLYDELQSKFKEYQRKNVCEAGFYNLFLLCSCPSLQGKSAVNDRLIKELSSLKHKTMPYNKWSVALRINYLRNAVAHHIVNMHEEKFAKQTGISSDDMIELMFNCLCLVFEKDYSRKQFSEARKVYDNLNGIIRESLEEINA